MQKYANNKSNHISLKCATINCCGTIFTRDRDAHTESDTLERLEVLSLVLAIEGADGRECVGELLARRERSRYRLLCARARARANRRRSSYASELNGWEWKGVE